MDMHAFSDNFDLFLGKVKMTRGFYFKIKGTQDCRKELLMKMDGRVYSYTHWGHKEIGIKKSLKMLFKSCIFLILLKRIIG